MQCGDGPRVANVRRFDWRSRRIRAPAGADPLCRQVLEVDHSVGDQEPPAFRRTDSLTPEEPAFDHAGRAEAGQDFNRDRWPIDGVSRP
jgi:hypothetical protein